jgi:hypothetical protein
VTGVGGEIKVVSGIQPKARDASTEYGTGVDRTGFASCVLQAMAGPTSGTPTTQTCDVKLQHSDASGSGYVDFQPGGVAAAGAVAQLTAADTSKRKAINLAGAKQYIRVAAVTAFTGGTTPTFASSASLVLGGADTLPAQSDD